LSTEQLPTDAGKQLTVVIVPTTVGEKSITSADIYYINQGAAGDEFKAIIADMKVKDGADFATNTYEVRIGGALTDDYYVYEIAGEELEEILYGDADGDGDVLEKDATLILRYKAGWSTAATAIDLDSADADADGDVLEKDATLILRYKAGWSTAVLGPQKWFVINGGKINEEIN